jgi:long-chain fatty acid transport protein
VSQTLLNIRAPGVVQDHITAGATWTTPGGHEITGYVLHALKHTVNGSGSLPPAFGPGDVTISLAETSVGLAYGVKW